MSDEFRFIGNLETHLLQMQPTTRIQPCNASRVGVGGQDTQGHLPKP